MPSAALVEWRTHRTGRIDELFAAHAEITGRGRALRRTQLNWALTMRVAAEFQGYARNLHNLAVDELSRGMADFHPTLAAIVRTTMKMNRRLDRGNPGPSALDRDFYLLGMDVWQEIEDAFPGRAFASRSNLRTLLDARNAIAHSDDRRLGDVEARGYPLTEVDTVRNWFRQISELCRMMDACVAAYVGGTTGGEQPW